MRSIRSFPCSYRLDTLPLNVGETMSDDGRYETQIAVVKEECKDADEAEIIKEFKRYEEEFLIPPEDALRSVIRKVLNRCGSRSFNHFFSLTSGYSRKKGSKIF